MWDVNSEGNMCSCMEDAGNVWGEKHEEKLVELRDRDIGK